ncbi:MAG: hypothetical protein J6Y74_00420 [Clostridia bacterium]|nr:hypothetical protein [Clostridia bacterium]
MKKIGICLFLIFLAASFAACVKTPQKEDPEEKGDHIPNYSITATLLSETNQADVTTEIRYIVPQEGLSAVKLRLYANAYQDLVVSPSRVASAYPNGASYGGCEITELSASKELLHYEIGAEDNTLLTVRFAQKLLCGEEITLTLRTLVTLANVKHRLGYADGYYMLSSFYPALCPFRNGKYRYDPYTPYGDPFYLETANFSVTVISPVGTLTAASALPLERESCGKENICRYELKEARDFACVISSRLLATEGEAGGIKIRYCYEKDAKSADTLAYIQEAIRTYEAAFGAFPYPSFTVVQAPFFEAGMEYSGLAMIDKDLSASERKSAVLHEAAHEWWHGKAGSDEILHPWQDEALAEYAVAYYYKSHNADLLYRKKIAAAEDDYSFFAAVKGHTQVDRPLSAGEEGYVETAYSKGLLMMISLAETRSFAEVNAALRRYADAYAGKIASPEDFLAAMEDALGKETKETLERWLYTPLPIG